MLEISKKLFAALNESDVIYCSWKGNDHLDKCLSGVGDIDILVSKNSKIKCYQILKELEFLHCESQFGCRIPNVEDWIGFDQESGNMIHVHLHFKIVAGKSGIMCCVGQTTATNTKIITLPYDKWYDYEKKEPITKPEIK